MSHARPTNPFNLCTQKFANGRLCGLPASPKHGGLCIPHARQQNAKSPQREDDLSAELASPAGDFITQIDINHVLGKLFSALAANRVSSRRAGTLAYIGCLLTQTQRGAKTEAARWELDIPTMKKLVQLKYTNSSATSSRMPVPKTPASRILSKAKK
jgi:hypothetical protein